MATPALKGPGGVTECFLPAPTNLLVRRELHNLPPLSCANRVQFASLTSTAFLQRVKILVLLSGSGLLGLVASQLGLVLGLDGFVRSADGRSALDSGGSEVRTIAVLGGLVGNSLVDPRLRRKPDVSIVCLYYWYDIRKDNSTYFRLLLEPL